MKSYCLVALAALGASSATADVPQSATSTASLVAPAPIRLRGVPRGDAWTDRPYAFYMSPAARPGAGELKFSAMNLPPWARLSSKGVVYGTPGRDDIGLYDQVSLIASDGGRFSLIGPFSITVRNPEAARSVTVSWTPPRENNDGTELQDLMGFRVEYARFGQPFKTAFRARSAAINRVVLDYLEPGNYLFRVFSVAANGVESEPSPFIYRRID